MPQPSTDYHRRIYLGAMLIAVGLSVGLVPVWVLGALLVISGLVHRLAPPDNQRHA